MVSQLPHILEDGEDLVDIGEALLGAFSEVGGDGAGVGAGGREEGVDRGDLARKVLPLAHGCFATVGSGESDAEGAVPASLVCSVF